MPPDVCPSQRRRPPQFKGPTIRAVPGIGQCKMLTADCEMRNSVTAD